MLNKTIKILLTIGVVLTAGVCGGAADVDEKVAPNRHLSDINLEVLSRVTGFLAPKDQVSMAKVSHHHRKADFTELG